MRVIDVLVDLRSQVSLQLQVEHRSVSQVQFALEFSWVFSQLFSVASHISDEHSVGDGADCEQTKGNKELPNSSSWHNLTYTEQVEPSVESYEVGSREVLVLTFLIFPVRLVSTVLIYVHEIHILNPSFFCAHNSVPDAAKDMERNEYEEEHPAHL